MNEAFYRLPEEKQLRIINAAMEVFACNEYKRASTDDIAAKAGISKGLLFYYFHNKQSLYLYVYRYCEELTRAQMPDEEWAGITDFFELMDYGARKKQAMVEKNPYLMDFVLRAFYSRREEAAVSEQMDRKIHKTELEAYRRYFENVDFSRFKEGVDPMKIYQMLFCMGDGYLNSLRREGRPPRVEDLMKEFGSWKEIMRKAFYKEEYLQD